MEDGVRFGDHAVEVSPGCPEQELGPAGQLLDSLGLGFDRWERSKSKGIRGTGEGLVQVIGQWWGTDQVSFHSK